MNELVINGLEDFIKPTDLIIKETSLTGQVYPMYGVRPMYGIHPMYGISPLEK